MNFLNKIAEYIKNIFGKKRLVLAEPTVEVNYDVKTNDIDELAKQYHVTNLQNDYESGIVKEEMLSEKEKADLISLYNSQIETLEKNIDNKKRELEEYKEKILIAKQKLSTTANN